MRFILLASLLIVGAVGCGGSSGYGDPLRGDATFEGQPIPRGDIILEPNSAKGNSGPGTIGKITDGRYATPSGKGIVGGEYSVTIRGYDGKVDPTAEPGANSPGNALFPAYRTEVNIPADGTEVDFDVSKK
ncbi:hypothetical protein [Blastopirellula marina]|uniref:Carboxypeptidase regulatory-like domain-containing protein n=1 Tax=Blastopirellula marina DSM 3645 TaxID=314230 RepID=A3ZYL4_9BACT|nr:hypothetical protein [Blastopirellula marina]EAQ78469.1 hypothetical protein DSM3645_07251 [Blastopirellula marina DSM 3645]